MLNVSSDAAINAYPRWGAYGASKAALRHLSAIWDAELAADGMHFLSLDPGDMDTPLHATAVPDADTALLKRPETAARSWPTRSPQHSRRPSHCATACRRRQRRRHAHDRRTPSRSPPAAGETARD